LANGQETSFKEQKTFKQRVTQQDKFAIALAPKSVLCKVRE
jgi:hypothetical protein